MLCDTLAYSLVFDSVLGSKTLFLLFLFDLFQAPLSISAGVAENFLLSLLSHCAFFLGELMYYFAFSYSLIIPKLGF